MKNKMPLCSDDNSPARRCFLSNQSLSRLVTLFASWVIVPTVVLGAGNLKAGSISGNTPGFVAQATDLGPVDPNSVITVIVWLKLHNEAQLNNLVAQQQ